MAGTCALAPSEPATDNFIILTPDERAALTTLLIHAVMDTGSNRKAALYQSILGKLTSLSPPAIEITEAMALEGAKALTDALGLAWDGLHPGRAPRQFPKWRHGEHASARQDDYLDLCRAILAAALCASDGLLCAAPSMEHHTALSPSPTQEAPRHD